MRRVKILPRAILFLGGIGAAVAALAIYEPVAAQVYTCPVGYSGLPDTAVHRPVISTDRPITSTRESG